MFNNITKIRESKSIKTSYLANRLGISEEELFAIEDGTINPDLSVLLNLSSILNVSIDELVGNSRSLPVSINKNKTNPWFYICLTDVILFVVTLLFSALFLKGNDSSSFGIEILFAFDDPSSVIIGFILLICVILCIVSLILGLKRSNRNKF